MIVGRRAVRAVILFAASLAARGQTYYSGGASTINDSATPPAAGTYPSQMQTVPDLDWQLAGPPH